MSTRQAERHIGRNAGHMMVPLVPGESERVGTRRQIGDTVRLMLECSHQNPQDDMATISVGPRDDAHWYQVRVPADSLEDLAAMLLDEAARRYERIERLAIQEDGQPSDKEGRGRDRSWAIWESLIAEGAVEREWVEELIAQEEPIR